MSEPTMKYQIHFDFDAENEPPSVLIWCDKGGDILEIFEDPTCTTDEWSWDDDDWEAGPIAKKILDFLNAEAEDAK